MKNTIIAAITGIALSTGVASAEGLGFSGYSEYAFEAEAFEFGLGADYGINDFTMYSEVVVTKPNNVQMDLDHVDLGVSYAAHKNVSIYAEVTLDSDLDYDETVVGVSVDF